MIVVLAGGVGAARLLSGLVDVVNPRELTVIANTGDDTRLFGLHVAPDLDTLTYTLAGASNPETGWGLSGESFTAMTALERYGAPTWFHLGDRDLATHLYRTDRLDHGATLSEVTAEITAAWGLEFSLLPMTNDPMATMIELAEGGVVEFQEYFVRLRHEVEVRAVAFSGAEQAAPAPGVLEALEAAEVIVIAPSNPVVSIGPILSVPGISPLLEQRRDRVVAISPIVAGAALKGPAARMLDELGHEPSALGVARLLAPVIGTMVLDDQDAHLLETVRDLGIDAVATATVMDDRGVAAALATTAIAAARARVPQVR